jgi:alpha-mannosidase
MKFTDLTVLLPCHSLEDFPVYYEGTQADELLSAWCAAWHPACLAAVQAIPNWHRLDVPPETLGGRLLVVPPFCIDRLPAGFAARAQSEGGWFVHESTPDAAVAAVLAGLDGGAAGIDGQLAADFLALGFCRLQIELLARHMRFSTNIDETHFQNEAVAAAHSAVAGDATLAREHLSHCFETLYESRKHFYPVDFYLVDLTLAAETTLGEPLAAQLAIHTPANFLLPTSLLRELRDSPAASWSALLSAIDAGMACVLGGEECERELPLLPLETSLASLSRGVSEYETLLGRRPQVYARRRAGLWPGLPQLLVKLAYQGALHCTLDDGRFPLGPQSKTRWEGLDTSVIDIVARVPLDAARAESFLRLSRTMADAMDSDHVATVVFAHWPAAASPWYDTLRRVARLSPVLGKFMLLDDYFSHTDMPGRLSKFEPDAYRTPYLTQAVSRGQNDPISRFVREHRLQAERAAANTMTTLRDLIVGHTNVMQAISAPAESAIACREPCEGEGHTAQDDGPRDAVSSALAELANVLPRAAGPPGAGYLVVNSLSFARRVGLEVSQLAHVPDVGKPVVATDTAGDRKFVVVEVPPLGFAWVAPADLAKPPSRAKPIAKENVLRNEFFWATISRTTGGIQSIYDFKRRGNQLSQQVALRTPAETEAPGAPWRDPDSAATYTSMRAESVTVTAACSAFGEIVSCGGLFDSEGHRMATFRQTVQAWAGSRILNVEIELADLEEPRPDPWNSYYAARFAWPTETADLWRGVGLGRMKTEATRLEAPEYLEIDSGSGAVSILTGGLPYHRRSDPRMFDSLLVVRGERARQFRLAIGVDIVHPATAALEFLTPPTAVFDAGPATASPSGWLFHVDAKNVVATHWQPLVEDQPAESAARILPVKGFRVRLLETEGRPGRVALRAFRAVASAMQVDFLGQTMLEVAVDDDKIKLDFAAYEWIEVEVVWNRPQ